MFPSFTTSRGLLLIAALAVAGPAWAGAIYGNLKHGDKPLEIALKLICGSETVVGKSDATGNYRLSIAGSGRCALSVGDKTAVVVLGSDPARYDFDVPDGAAPLRQR
jgi:hypothetical protein